MNLEPEEERQEVQAAKLGDQYDGALLGATIGIGEMQFVYSVRQLIGLEKISNPGKPVAEIRKSLGAEIQSIQRDHGILAPVFVNDEICMGEMTDEAPASASRIIIPGKPNWTPPPIN